MFPSSRRLRHLYALFGYAAIAIVFTWPLATHFGTHLTGSPAGDTGVYVWNQWVFQHELLEHRRSPYFTDKIFSLSGRANLSLHNYTAFQDLVALPFISWLGVVATFNLVYLLMTVLTGYAAFLLALRVTGSAPESWLAGLLFAWSPVLVTRGGAHFSLVAAAPLAIFLLLLLRTAERQRLRDAVALGATCWWAASTDAYYAVYTLLIAGLFLAGRVLTVERVPGGTRRVPWALDVLVFCVGGLVLSMIISGGWQFTLLGAVASMRSLYTPMLVLTLLVCLRLAWRYRPNVSGVDGPAVVRLVRLGAAAALVTAVLLAPVLYAVGLRLVEGRWDAETIYWRSSPPGIDLAALVLPNPNHPLTPEAVRAWLTPRADAYYENVASLTWLAPLVVALAWRTGWRLPRPWVGLLVGFGLLALGPFVHVAGVNTHIPGPWAVLRYVPIVGLARTPTRFSVVVMLALAVLFAGALVWLVRRWPARRRLLLTAVTLLLLFELLPAPRPLYSAEVPRIYQTIAATPGDFRILELPTGIRDGTRSLGDFNARTQYFQTVHRKRIIGGYLSRVSQQRVADVTREPMVEALIWLSGRQRLDPSRRQTLLEAGGSFIREADIRFVVIDRTRAPDALRDFAVAAFGLRQADVDGPFELYVPSAADTARR